MTNNKNKDIFNRLKELLNIAYAPYSHFQVASIIVDARGNFYEGVNVESVAYTPGICAERNAINSAITQGMKPSELRYVYILAKNTKKVDKKAYTYPCGPCRQVISEQSNNNAKVVVFNLDGKVKNDTIAKLFPNSFSKKDLI